MYLTVFFMAPNSGYSFLGGQNNMLRIEDYIGKRFGKLTVLGNAKTAGRIRWKCRCDCGNDTVIRACNIKSGNTKSCGCLKSQSGENNPSWNGGKTRNQGYVLVKSIGHHRQDSRGYVREHILIAEKTLGRRIGPDEEVHHKNRDVTDNRPENIEILSRAEHMRKHPDIGLATRFVSITKK